MDPQSQPARVAPGGVMSRRSFLGAAAGVAGAMALASCGSPSGGGGGGSGSKLSGTLNYYDHTSLSNPAGKKLIADYEKLHPGVKINILSAPAATIDQQIFTLVEGGSPPDLFSTSTNMFPWQNVKDGWWLDLTKYAHSPDPYVSGNKAWVDVLSPGVLPTLTFKGNKIYSLTTTGFDCAFFYNKKIFKKVGVEPPKTWAQLLTAFDKFKSAGYIPLYYELGDLAYGSQALALYVDLEDTFMSKTVDRIKPADPSGQLTVEELVRAIKDGVYSARNPDYQAVWQFMKRLAPYMQHGPGAANDSDTGLAAFESGKVATWWEGSFNGAEITNVDWGAFVIPDLTPETSQYGTREPQAKGCYGATAGEPWVIPSHTKDSGKLDLAIDFVYWLSAPAQTKRFAEGNGILNLVHGGSNPSDMDPFVTAANHLCRFSVAELALPQSFTTTRCRLMEAYVLGTMSLGSAMAQMQSAMDSAAAQATTEFGL